MSKGFPHTHTHMRTWTQQQSKPEDNCVMPALWTLVRRAPRPSVVHQRGCARKESMMGGGAKVATTTAWLTKYASHEREWHHNTRGQTEAVARTMYAPDESLKHKVGKAWAQTLCLTKSANASTVHTHVGVYALGHRRAGSVTRGGCRRKPKTQTPTNRPSVSVCAKGSRRPSAPEKRCIM